MKNVMVILGTTAIVAATPAMAGPSNMSTFCEMAFFQVDANEDDMLDAQEFAGMQDATFKGLDMNADGSISREEYTACTQMSDSATANKASTDTSEESFAQLDTDSDGSVTLVEYFDLASAAYETAFAADAPQSDMATSFDQPFVALPDNMTADEMNFQDRRTFLDASARTFAVADDNLDGTLTRDEWLARAEQYEIDIESINQRFDDMDGNADEMIGRDEYELNWRSVLGSAAGQADRDGFTDQSKGIPAYYFYISTM